MDFKETIEKYKKFYEKIPKENIEIPYQPSKTYKEIMKIDMEWINKYVNEIFLIELIEKTYSKEFTEYLKNVKI